MRIAGALFALSMLASACASGEPEAAPAGSSGIAAVEPPVALDATPAIAYPAGVDDTTAVLTVTLRLFVDEQGHVIADSTRIAESSGVAALDSAAVEGAPRLRYSPALRDGEPLATAFVQQVEFRRP